MKELLRIYQGCASAEGTAPVENCSLFIAEGEILSLMGGADSGRVLLSEILSGRRSLSRGQLYLRDSRLREHRIPPEETLWIEESRRMTGCLSVEANLLCLGAKGKESRGKGLQALLREMEVACGPRQRLESCSRTEQIQLWFLLACLKQNPLVCLDMEGLVFSEEEMLLLGKTIRSCRRRGISTVVFSGGETGLLSISDRIGVIRDGRVEKVFYGPEEWRTSMGEGGRKAGAGGSPQETFPEGAEGKDCLRLPEDCHLHLINSRSIGWNLMLSLPRRVGTRFGVVQKSMESFLDAEFRRKFRIQPEAELVQDLSLSEKKLLVLYRTLLQRPGKVWLEESLLRVEDSRKPDLNALILEMKEQGCLVIRGKQEKGSSCGR